MGNGFGFCTSDPASLDKKLQDLGQVDVVVGIPSYNEADNIAHVVGQCSDGLRHYFPRQRALIVNVDNHSPDNTREVFRSCASRVPKLYISTPDGVRGKGNNFLNLFQAALAVKAKAVIAVDADLLSITPDWVHRLASPILGGCDFVSPLYARNEYDGTITNHICYPLIRGLLGKEVRQPIGGDFGFSARFVGEVLKEDWSRSTRHYGIDIFLTLRALLGDFRLGQTALGAKVHKPSAPKLGPMFSEVVTTLFGFLICHRHRWFQRNNGQDVRMFGEPEPSQPQQLGVDYKAIKQTSLEGFADQKQALGRYLEASSFRRLESMMAERRMQIGPRWWSQMVYDLLYAFDIAAENGAVVEALKPLFFARVASFIRRTLDMDHDSSEQAIRCQAREFRRSRRYLFRKYSTLDTGPLEVSYG